MFDLQRVPQHLLECRWLQVEQMVKGKEDIHSNCPESSGDVEFLRKTNQGWQTFCIIVGDPGLLVLYQLYCTSTDFTGHQMKLVRA